MPERFEAVYTDAQRDALAIAYEDRRVRPARLVVDLAERGELAEGLEPFKVHGGVNTVRDFARKLRVRRAGEHSSALAKQPPRDAIETLRRRLVTVCEETLTALEKQKPEQRDVERIRQLGRAIREAAAIPAPTDPPPPRPGHTGKDQTTGRTEGVTRGGIAGGVLAAAHREGTEPINAGSEQPAPDQPSTSRPDDAENTPGATGQQHDAPINANTTNDPGEWARAEIAQLVAGAEGDGG